MTAENFQGSYIPVRLYIFFIYFKFQWSIVFVQFRPDFLKISTRRLVVCGGHAVTILEPFRQTVPFLLGIANFPCLFGSILVQKQRQARVYDGPWSETRSATGLTWREIMIQAMYISGCRGGSVCWPLDVR